MMFHWDVQKSSYQPFIVENHRTKKSLAFASEKRNLALFSWVVVGMASKKWGELSLPTVFMMEDNVYKVLCTVPDTQVTHQHYYYYHHYVYC